MRKMVAWVLCGILCVALDQNITSLKANFVQYTFDSQGKMSTSYSGSLIALAPHYAKWEYKTPLQKIVYLKNKELISYEPMLAQVIYTHLSQVVNFLNIIKNAKQSSQDPNLYIAHIDEREYRLHTKDSIPQSLEYEDEFGNRILIKLNQVLLNPKISQKAFNFQPPRDIDIIKH